MSDRLVRTGLAMAIVSIVVAPIVAFVYSLEAGLLSFAVLFAGGIVLAATFTGGDDE